jgi:transcription antitermination factor NusG
LTIGIIFVVRHCSGPWDSHGGSMPERLKMDSLNRNWYALRVRARLARIAAAVLRGKGYEEYLPVYRSRRRWSDRTKTVEMPLFPGYLFCRFDARDRLVPVVTTPGVMGIVGAGKTPIPVADDEIDSVRRIVDSGLAARPCPFVAVGTRISIERGPLTGLEGVVTNADGVSRLIASVTLLQRSVAVEVDRDWIRPITSPLPRAS